MDKCIRLESGRPQGPGVRIPPVPLSGFSRFTTEDAGIVARQHVDKLTRTKASALGIDTTGLGTHVGRRTVVTAMSEDGVPLDDIARHVGHRSSTTTAGYVRSHRERDRATAKRAASILDVPAV